MLIRLAFVLTMIFALGAPAHAVQPLRVVATFSILQDMTREIGGDKVQVESLVGPDQDVHSRQFTPQDAKKIADADVVVANGLGFEPWLDRLLASVKYAKLKVVASRDITPIAVTRDKKHDHDHGLFDPHAWQDMKRAKSYALTIAEGLAAADPDNAAFYRANGQAYAERIEAEDRAIRALLADLPVAKRKIVTGHDAFTYFAHAYGFQIASPIGGGVEAAPSAAAIAKVIAVIRKQGAKAVFVETITDPRLAQQIARDTGAVLGEPLYSDALSGPDGPAATYLDMMRHNATAIHKALMSAP